MPPFPVSRFSFSAFFLVFIFLAQAVFLAAVNSAVSDESAHIVAGYSYWKGNTHELNPEHPPLVKRLAALPLLGMKLTSPVAGNPWQGVDQWKAGWDFLYGLGNPARKMIFSARLALFPLIFLAAVCLFLWTRDLAGRTAALSALLGFAFFPELIAHALLVTTDFAAAVFYFASFYFFYRFYRSCRKQDLTFAAVMTGLGAVSKFSLVLIFPLVISLAFWMAWQNRCSQPEFRFPLFLLILIAAAVISDRTPALLFAVPVLFFAIYRFFPNLPGFREPRLRFAAGMVLTLMAIAALIVALVYFEPYFWFEKFRPFRRFLRGWQIFRGHALSGTHPGYLLGEYSPQGWWYYYFIAMAVKIPIPLLIASFLGFFRIRNPVFLVPPIFFLAVACFNHTNIGVRHVLPVYLFLTTAAGCGFAFLIEDQKKFLGRPIAALLGIWLVAGTLSQFPHYLSYFNEAAGFFGGKEKILSDSNIAWGQDLNRLTAYVQKEKIPEIKVLLHQHTAQEMTYYGLPFTNGYEDFKLQRPGTYAVDVFSYQGLLVTPGFEWVQVRKPDAIVGGSIWIYKL